MDNKEVESPAITPVDSLLPLPQGPFTSEQLKALRYQIYTFKLITSNNIIPNDLRNFVLNGDAKGIEPSEVKEGDIVTSMIANAAIKQQKENINDKNNNILKPKGSRLDLLLPKYTSDPDFQLPSKIVNLSAESLGIDPRILIQERERFINARIRSRLHELEKLPSNISEENNKKLKSLIELKSLRLLEKQKQVRKDILSSLKRATTLDTAVDRNLYKRVRKQSLREARETERLERVQRLEREKLEKNQHKQSLEQIIVSGADLLSYHRSYNARCVKLSSLVNKYHINAQKEEEKRQQRLAQERINALRANDEAAYLKLVDRAKDGRIAHLLDQTQSYLKTLTDAMLDQKSGSGENDLHFDEKAVVIDNQDESKDYYSSAHRIQEIVTEQASILIGGKLKEYQVKGLQWMVSLYNNRLNGILADEMGLGKTIQTISLVTYLIEKKKQIGPYLVIVPLSTITNWELEFDKWAPSVTKIVFKGSPTERNQKRQEIRNGNFNVVITTFEYIIREKAVLSKHKWVYMIIDEGHRMKNANSKLAQTLQYYSTRYRLILTGTPLQNNLPELWALLNFILPKIFNSVDTFDEWFNHPFANQGNKEEIKLNEEEALLIIRGLHKVLRPFLLRRLKKDVESELPDKVETVVRCPMSALQLRLYDQIKHRRRGFEMKGRALSNLVMQFKKVCNHPFLFDEVENAIHPSGILDETLYRVAGKFELLDRILPKYEASGHRVLIFFQMTNVMDIFEDYLKMKTFTYLRLDGSTKADERTSMLKIFNRPVDPPFLFMLSTRAGGLGLNLQTADTVIIFDSDWNPHQDLQAQDRAHRIGQTKEVRILRLITSNSVEESILARAQYKLDMDGKVIQAGKFDNKTSDRERDELLRSLFENEDSDDKDEVEGYMEDADLNAIISRSEEEIELFGKMDEERMAEERASWRARGNKGDVPPRLMQDDELPSVYLEEEEEEIKEDLILGRGARARKDVIYDDGLNDDQFIQAIDEGDIGAYVQRKHQSRRERREKRFNKDQSEESLADNVTEGTEGEDDKPRLKRIRLAVGPKDSKSNDNKDQKKIIRKGSGFASPAWRRRRMEINDTEIDPLTRGQRYVLRQIMTEAYNKVCQAEVATPEGIIRKRCYLYDAVPNKKDYPDYHQLIRKPIALEVIRERMNSSYYKNIQQFILDFHLMFRNAMTYNYEGSEVYADAIEMKSIFDQVILDRCGESRVLPEPTAEDEKAAQEAELAGELFGADINTSLVSTTGIDIDEGNDDEEDEEEDNNNNNYDDDDEETNAIDAD